MPPGGRIRAWGVAALAILPWAATRVPAADPPRTVAVAAAANLRPALQELAAEFERLEPGAKVLPTYGASGLLVTQIRQGAPFDLFLGADRGSADRIREAGLAAGEPFPYALGRLFLWLAASVPAAPARPGLYALLDPSIRRVAIANPALAPYGAAAEQALRSAGILEAVGTKLVLGESVLQAAQFAQSGNAQAALLPASLATVEPLASQGRAAPVPAGTHEPIEQSGVILSRARDRRLVEAFVQFLRGPAGRAILERHGYAPPRR